MGMVIAYPERYRLLDGYTGKNVLVKSKTTFENVAIVISGGGAGGPLFDSFVGEGLADAAVVGEAYAAPSAYAIYETVKLLGRKKGALLIYNNYAGDFLNNDMAEELCTLDGLNVKSIQVTDNIDSSLEEERGARGGLSGISYLIKIAASCTNKGFPLEEVYRITQKANKRLSSISVLMDEKDNQILYGVGFSGEPPTMCSTEISADSIAEYAMNRLFKDLNPADHEKLYILVNRLNATTYTESYVMVKAIDDYINTRKWTKKRISVGNYFSPNSERGYYLSMLSADEEICCYLDHICQSDAFIL